MRAQSVASLFTNLPADVAHLFTPTNGIIAGVGGAGAAAIHPKDDEIASHIYRASGARHDFFHAGATIGDGVEQGSFALGMYVVGRVSKRDGVASSGADLIDAQIVNGLLTQGIKVSTNRKRPSGGPRSFPSGHTSATFATAEVLREHYGWKVGAAVYAIGGYVSIRSAPLSCPAASLSSARSGGSDSFTRQPILCCRNRNIVDAARRRC
ncbi:MAG: hypothetical protein DMF88_02970 [Acidobacteria bacterium]|nr:MAG: hypothetical protein DMF88_02970 [Acidobacteriota bacterium]